MDVPSSRKAFEKILLLPTTHQPKNDIVINTTLYAKPEFNDFRKETKGKDKTLHSKNANKILQPQINPRRNSSNK